MNGPRNSPEDRDDAAWQELLRCYRTPEPSEGFADATLWRIAMGRHDPLGATPPVSPDFTDRVCAALAADRAGHRTAPAIAAAASIARDTTASSDSAETPAARSETGSGAHAPARAPAPVELRSRVAPYLVAAAMLVATAVALMWPKGPGATMPRVQAIAEPLFDRTRTSSDPVSMIGGLIPVAEFTTTTEAADELFEVPRFAPPSLDDFFAADLEARHRELRAQREPHAQQSGDATK
ncbi:MAG: hypothetical protein KDC95_11235 [Planctomycetes bacterium]|nr:hypothetical protein [Planctomycetota bacterium]